VNNTSKVFTNLSYYCISWYQSISGSMIRWTNIALTSVLLLIFCSSCRVFVSSFRRSECVRLQSQCRWTSSSAERVCVCVCVRKSWRNCSRHSAVWNSPFRPASLHKHTHTHTHVSLNPPTCLWNSKQRNTHTRTHRDLRDRWISTCHTRDFYKAIINM